MREDDKEVVLTGRRVCAELLKNCGEYVVEVYLRKGLKLEPPLQHLIDRAAKVTAIDESRLEKLSEGVPHQGIAVRLRRRSYGTLQEFLNVERTVSSIVVLDQIVDPRNVGAIFRAAEVTGMDAVIISGRNSAPLSAVAAKASAGATELLPSFRVTNLQRALQQLKEAGYWVVGTAMEGCSLFDFDFPPKTALVMGSEGEGMRNLTTRECDMLVTLPMLGKIGSLNVSQAASVVFYEFVRQHRSKR